MRAILLLLLLFYINDVACNSLHAGFEQQPIKNNKKEIKQTSK